MNNSVSVYKFSKRIFFLFFAILLLQRIIFYFVFVQPQHNCPQCFATWLLGLRYDMRYAAIIALFTLLIGMIKWLNPYRTQATRKIWMLLLAVLGIFVILLLYVDIANYAYLQRRTTASIIDFLNDPKYSLQMVWESYPLVRAGLLFLLTLTIFFFVLRRMYWRAAFASSRQYFWSTYIPTYTTKIHTSINTVVLSLILGFLIYGRANDHPLRWSDAFNSGNELQANFALNPLQTFFSTLQFRQKKFDINKTRAYYPIVRKYLGMDTITVNDTTPISFSRKQNGMPTAMNVVVVICESFSSYKSSLSGNPLNTTPYINQLSNKGILFDHCYTPLWGTARGVWATVTGIPDVQMPTTSSRNMLAVSQKLIINEFTDHNKMYFIGGSANWANIRGVLENIDGLRLFEQDQYPAKKVDVWGVSDKNVFLYANTIFATQQKPFVAVIQTADNHRPYTIPKEDRNEFHSYTLPEDSLRNNGFETNAEYNAFRYFDFCVEKFIEAAKKEKYFSNTLFVFIGDHGIIGTTKLFPSAWSDGNLVQFHVPLLFYSEKMESQHRRIHAIASQVDVFPSIAGLLQIPYTNTTLGRDLFHPPFNDTSNKNIQRAFTMDPESNKIGLITPTIYLQKINGKRNDIHYYDMQFQPQRASDTAATIRNDRLLLNGIYETSKYLLFNNKK